MAAVRRALTAAALAALAALPGLAQDYDATRSAAMNSLAGGDCPAAWEVLWPAAKAGEALARADLATLIYARGLRPPGHLQDVVTLQRDAFVLAVHGLASGDPASREMALQAARANAGWGQPAAGLARCLESGEAGADCAATALESGLVPGFAPFAEAMDARAAGAGAPMASCAE